MLAAAIALAGVVGCNRVADNSGGDAAGKAKLKRIILLTNGNSPYWDAARFGMQQGAEEFKLAAAGLQAVMEVNDGTPAGQIGKLRQFASQSDVVAVAVSALDAGNVAVAEEMRKLQSKGVHVIALDGDVDRAKLRDARKYYIGTDNAAGGRELGTAAKNLAPDGGSYVCFVGRTGAQNAIDRMNGFKEAAGDKFKEEARMGDDLDRTKARDNVRNALRNFPEMKVLVGIWSYNSPAIVDIVKETEKRDQVKIVTFDAEKLAVEQMGNGFIDAMVVQNPYNIGRQAVRLLKAMIEKDKATIDEMFPHADEPDGDLFDTGLKVVVPGPHSPLKADMFDKKTEFLELKDFKEWLAKYKLEGS